MISESDRVATGYRVTFFFGPDPMESQPDVLTCVFNVKKRSWKAGVQVAVEINRRELSALRQQMGLDDRLAKSLVVVDPREHPHYHQRIDEFFAQAVCWCKLDLRLQTGLAQENQRIQANVLTTELEQALPTRFDYVVSYILGELDLVPDQSSSSI